MNSNKMQMNKTPKININLNIITKKININRLDKKLKMLISPKIIRSKLYLLKTLKPS